MQKWPQTLTKRLDALTQEYKSLPSSPNKKQFFLDKRKRYNEFLSDEKMSFVCNLVNEQQLVEQTALFIFLNKTCFNGLYRVSQKSGFNVPWNGVKNPTLYDKTNLKKISQFLSNKDITFIRQDFANILSSVQAGDFVYLDPPYDTLKKDTFVSYTEDKFSDQEQLRLLDFFKKLDKRGCYVALSNHSTPNIQNLYAQYHVQIVYAKRMVNCQGDKRGDVSEVIITNYKKLPNNLSFSFDQKLMCVGKCFCKIVLPQFDVVYQFLACFDNPSSKDTESRFFNVHQIPEWYVDFNKVRKNLSEYQKPIQQLQAVLNLPNLENNLFLLASKDFVFLKLLFLLIGQRWDKLEVVQDWQINANQTLTPRKWKQIFLFLTQAGLIKVLTDQTINHVFDYLFGIEVGLDSNARKNRTGKIMETKVQQILESKQRQKIISWYTSQKSIPDITKTVDLALSQLSPTLEDKRFDFIYQKANTLYLLEVNCYNVGGSKINETIRAYQKLAQEVTKQGKNLEFIWITDGIYWQNNPKVWNSTKQKFKYLLSLKDFETF